MKNYDPGLVIVTFGPVRLVAPAEGTFVSIERSEDAFTKVVGARGDVVRVRNRDRSGTITVTLQSASPSNDLLTAIANAIEIEGAAPDADVYPITVRYLNGTDLAAGPNAWIRKRPQRDYAMEHSNVEWVFDIDELTHNVGSAVV